MPNTTRRPFGRIRKLPSGRWQARYPGPDGRDLAAPSTFVSKTEATRYLSAVETDLARGIWLDPARGDVRLEPYAAAWIKVRTVGGRPLSPRTRANYENLLRLHITPTLGALPLSSVTPERVRLWQAQVSQKGATTAAQAYRLLHAVLATAAEEGTYLSNPCRLRGASTPKTPERPLLSVTEVESLAQGMPEHLRALVVLAFWGALRLGELLALQVGDLDLDVAKGTGAVRIERAQGEVDNQAVQLPPKAQSARTVHLPRTAVKALADHLDRMPAGLPTARVFARVTGQSLRAWDVQRHWVRARETAGLPQARLHDLRHAGLTLAAQRGFTVREVMRRAGHSSSAAAMRYQHAAESRDRDLASSLDAEPGSPDTLRARSGHA